jgi:phosphoribosylamine---glycine ligase
VRVLFFDQEYLSLNLVLRSIAWGHNVRVWQPPLSTGDQCPVGAGAVTRVLDWEPHMDWADLIINTGNAHYQGELSKYFATGFPLFATNQEAAAWELDRFVGQQVFEKAKIPTLQYEICNNIDQAIRYVKTQEDGCAIKPWGGSGDKSLSCLGKTGKECEYILRRWKEEGKGKGKLLCQARVEGIEMAAGGWFGPGGWSEPINETWEHKKHLAGDLGCNTGEQGSVLRYTKRSKLFHRVAKPLTDALHKIGFVGNCDVNCIIDEDGRPWPLEFTMRMGWPAMNILTALHQGDPIVWMKDLLEGKDTLRVSDEIALGVCMTHGNYPFKARTWAEDTGYPISGITTRNWDKIAPQHMRRGAESWETAGEYVCVVTGTGDTVRSASRAAYNVADAIRWPSNPGYRNDIGRRLSTALPRLQSFGYAEGVRYDS